MKPPFPRTVDKEFAGLQDAGGERQRQLREGLQGTLSSAVVATSMRGKSRDSFNTGSIPPIV